MTAEFKRFGLTDVQRKLTGLLQISAAIGLCAGLVLPYIGLMASGGLALMMLVAFVVRIKIKDRFVQSAPSLFFMAVNLFLTYAFYKML